MSINIGEMEANGTFEVWNNLTTFTSQFINRNYPLSKEDLASIMNDNPTQNVLMRQKALDVMNNKIAEIVERTKVTNENFMQEFSKNPTIEAFNQHSFENQQQSFQEFQQELLEAHWEMKEEMVAQQTQENNATTQENVTEDASQQDSTPQTFMDEIAEQNKAFEERQEADSNIQSENSADTSQEPNINTPDQNPNNENSNETFMDEIAEQNQQLQEEKIEETQQSESISNDFQVDTNSVTGGYTGQEMIDQTVDQGIDMGIGVNDMNACVSEINNMAQAQTMMDASMMMGPSMVM